MAKAIIISNAPFITALNGIFYVIDPATEDYGRIWNNSADQRIYYDDGWKMANPSTGDIFFYEKIPGASDPWSVPVDGWDSDIDAYKEYASKITVTMTEDEETTETVTTTRNEYYLTSDTIFNSAKKYFTRVGEGTATNPYSYIEAEVEAGKAVPAKTYFEETKVGVTTITTTNIRTGKTTVKVTESRFAADSLLDYHKRYTPPEVEVGKVYRFSFVKDFEKLGYIKPQSEDYVDEEENDSDITRGIFKVDSVTNYYSLILSGVDIYQNLYLPLGISKDVFELDRKGWMDDDAWYRLVNPMLPAQVYYVPSSIIEGYPDSNVAEYKRYQIITDIGIFNDPDLMAEIITCINMLFKAHFGIPTASELATYDSVWIPTSYYKWMEDQRKLNIEEFMQEKSKQYYNTLFLDEYNQLAKENKELKKQVKTYEELLTKV